MNGKPSKIDAFVTLSRGLSATAGMQEYYGQIFKYYIDPIITGYPNTDQIKLVTVFSQSKLPSSVKIDDTHYIIYDQYFGQYLNMCNRLYLYSLSEQEGYIYALKLCAEEARRIRDSDMYLGCLGLFVANRDAIHRVKDVPEEARKHQFFTHTQELFVMYHELFHISEALNLPFCHEYGERAKDLISGERSSQLALAEITPELVAEVACDIFAMEHVFGSTLMVDAVAPGLNPGSTKEDTDLDRPEKQRRILDTVVACYLAILHERSLLMLRAHIGGTSVIRKNDATKSPETLIPFNNDFGQIMLRKRAMMYVAKDHIRHLSRSVVTDKYVNWTIGSRGENTTLADGEPVSPSFLLSEVLDRHDNSVQDSFALMSTHLTDQGSPVRRAMKTFLSQSGSVASMGPWDRVALADQIWLDMNGQGSV